MADNVSDALKNLNRNLKEADTNLATLSKNFHTVFAEAVRRAAQDAGADIGRMFDSMAGKVGSAKKANKLKMLFELVDEHGAEITPQKLKAKIDRIANAAVNKEGTKVHLGFEWVDYEKAMAQLERFKQQYKLLKDLPGAYDTALRLSNQSVGGATASGTALGRARAKEMAEVQKYTKLANDELLRQQQIEQKIAEIRARGGKSAQFEGERRSIAQLNNMLEDSRRQVEAYKRTLQGLGTRGRAAAAGFGGDGSRTAIKEQTSLMRELYNLTKQYRQMQDQQRHGKVINPQDLEDTRRRLREILADMKRIEAEHPGSRKTAAARLETERLRDRWREVHRETKAVNTSFISMIPTVQRLASAFGVAFSVQGLVQFGKKLVETRGEFELQQVALRSILQNKQVADEIWDKTMRAALQSPFTAMQLTKYTKQLAAYRIETEKLFDTTKRLADVSAGLGVDMQRLILAYGQVKAANYLRASEIRQFTEAGVNVLGELSDYFARTRGEMVSTAQVMDMVQKRMVKFEDVEAIFKHMTDEGGIFYNMQYIQSQTVRGQINKLHDAYDQMLNSIGQGNQGVLKNMVSIANNLVRNWREVAGTIQGIAWAFIFVQLGKIAIGIHRIGTEAITSGSKVSWLARQLGKLREKSKGYEFGKVFSKANVVLAAGAAVAFVTGKFIQHLNAVRQLNEKYNELSLRAYETQENLSGIQKTLSQNNQNIERLNKVSKKSKEHEEELANARKQNAEIVNRLKRDYPELADGMNIQKNGVVTLTSAISDYNEQLEYTILLNQLAKGNAWNDDFQTNVTEMTQSLQSAEQTLASYQALAKSILLQMKNMDFGFREKRQANELKTLLEGIIGLEKGDYEGLNKLLSGNPLRGYNYLTQTRSWRTAFQPILLDKHNVDATKKQLERSESVLYDMLKNAVRRDKEYMTEIQKEWGGDIDKFIHNNAERIQKNVDDGKKDTFKAIREYGLQMGFAFKGAQDIFNQTLNSGNKALFGGLGFRFFEYPGVGETTTDTETPEEKQAKIDAAWRRRINLLEEMKKRYDELSKSAYGYAKSNTTVRTEFGKSWGKIFGGVLSMNAVQFTSAAEMEAAFETILAKAGAASSAVKEEIQKKADSYGARVPIDVQVRIREDFGRQMEDAFGNYELTLELQKLNLPSDVLSDLFDLETVDLSDLRRKVVDFYNERLAVEADPTDLIKQVEGYYKKLDDMERKQQRDRIKDYAKYLEYELSERAKIEMEYTRKSADVAANQAFTSEQKEQIQKRLKEERDKAIAKQEWEDFKSSETYIQMMEDLEHQGTNALIAMRTELEHIRENAENLSPRALKEVVNALEKIDEITIKRGMPISNIRNAVAGVRGARVEALKSGLSWEQVSSRRAAKQTQADIKAQLLPMEQQFNILQSQLGAEKEIARLEQERYENGLKLGEVFGKTFMTGDNEYLQELITNSLTNIESSQERINELTEQRKTASEADTKAIDPKLAEERANLECLKAERDLLEKQLELNIAITKEALNRAATPEERASLQARINELEEELKKLREQDAAVGNLTKKYGVLGDTVQDAVQKLAGWSQQAVDVFNSFKTMMTSLGVDTDTDAWDDWSTAFETIGTVASTAASMATKIASGDYIGAALDAVKGIMDIVTQWAGNNDRELERQIQKQQEKIDDLKDAYERLEKAIEKTWTTMSYIDTYNQQVENIKQQIEALEAQRNAENSKKNTDEDKIREYDNAIQEAYDELDELAQKQIEVFGGLGEVNYRSAAEEFVSAWKDAFLETGDGLEALQEHFDEFLQEWFVKQATMRIAGAMLERTFRMIDESVKEGSDGDVAVTMAELQAIRDEFATQAPLISEALEELAGMWDLGNGEGSLSGLAAGIQGMTEEQANILEAYWNSVRMYTANIDGNVERIANILGAGGSATNPQLQQLQIIAQHTQAIHTLLDNVTRSGHPQGGLGIKVFNN